MTTRTNNASLKSWLSLENDGLLAKQSYTYDGSSRIIEEYKTRIDVKVGGSSLYRSYTYDTNGKPVGGTPTIKEWTIVQENNQSVPMDVLAINSFFKDTAGSLTAGIDYDSISYSYPTASSEVISYKLSGATIRAITVTYLTSAKVDIDTVVIA